MTVRPSRWGRATRLLVSTAHLYLGLTAGIILTIVGLSGSVLVFHDEIDAWLTPGLHRVEAPAAASADQNAGASADQNAGAWRTAYAPLDRVLSAVRAYRPDVVPSFVRLPRRADESVEVWTDGEAGPRMYVDPYTALVLGDRMPRETLTGWLFELHVELFAGEAGHWIIGMSGLFLLLLVASGLILWWPRTGQWLRAIRLRTRGSWRSVNYDLHGTTGAWASVGLVVLALTGSSLVFHDAFSNALHSLTASDAPPPPPESFVREGAPDASLGQAMSNAERVLPGGRFTWIYLPTAPSAPVSLRKRMPGEWHPNGRSYIYTDRHTGAVLAAHNAMRAQIGTRIYDVLYPLHIGRFGLWSKLLYALLGFAPLLLMIGGTVIWWDRRSRRRRREASSRNSVPAIACERG